MISSIEQLAAMIDVSAVRADSDWDDVRLAALFARQRGCVAVFSLPGFTKELAKLLDGATKTVVGGVIGFPSGGETTTAKVFLAQELIGLGCSEIDMVMNIGQLRSGWLEQVENDIRSVKQSIGSVPLKVILECNKISEDQIRIASELAVRAEADWVKTGTGWTAGGTTVQQIQIIKQTIGNKARIKAAGGIGDLKTLLELHQAGAERFGIGYKKAQDIFDELVTSSQMSEL
ncbi:MAG: deoxyribose-phosphate aldolase [Planctomycetaceae bacterium]|jgi:deoxyribose-phosphate aldolase|nr:deoxyribose-phosphate aldolase [Planctomycetaceae bacterium]